MPSLPHPPQLTRLAFGLLALLSGLPPAHAQQAPDVPPAAMAARPPDIGLAPEALRAVQHFVGRWRGLTYHVCCGGCRDYFLEHPEQVLQEYRARQMQRRESPRDSK